MAYVSMEQLIMKLASIPEKICAEVKKSMKVSAAEVRDTAKKKFGKFQPAVGDFPAWDLLTIETLHRKMDQGGAESEDPLVGHYPPGEGNHVWNQPLRGTIDYKVDGMIAAVGTDDPLGEYHEYGTKHIPPRPFLRPALYESQVKIKENVKDALGEAMKRL